MTDLEFLQCRTFLEELIQRNIDNSDSDKLKILIDAYKVLITKKSEVTIQWMKSDESIRKEWVKSQTEQAKAQADATKKSIEKGNLPLINSNSNPLNY